jgi:hypothetical protein
MPLSHADAFSSASTASPHTAAMHDSVALRAQATMATRRGRAQAASAAQQARNAESELLMQRAMERRAEAALALRLAEEQDAADAALQAAEEAEELRLRGEEEAAEEAQAEEDRRTYDALQAAHAASEARRAREAAAPTPKAVLGPSASVPARAPPSSNVGSGASSGSAGPSILVSLESQADLETTLEEVRAGPSKSASSRRV